MDASHAPALHVGFLEQAAFEPQGLKISGWAVCKSNGRAPATLRVSWEDVIVEFAPSVSRPDVAKGLGLPDGLYGFAQLIPLPTQVTPSWALPRITAHWPEPNGFTLALPSLKGVQDGHLKCLGFESFEDFQRYYQNPAFRLPHPRLQAYGASRALQQAGSDRSYWLSAAILALYRCFEDHAFEPSEAALLIEQWKTLQREVQPTAKGPLLRWATSMHLAAGYTLLGWGKLEEAEAEFGAIAAYADRVESWPQSTTNMAIGMFIAAWLAWRRGDTAAARANLLPTDRMFQASVGVLRIWNWHMFEELKNAVRVTQMCFGFLRRLEGSPAPHIVPPKTVLSLRDVSPVLQRLIDKGAVPDEPLP